MKGLGRKRALVITGEGGMDEATPFGLNHYALLENDKVTLHEFRASEVGISEVQLNDIRGGEAPENAEILKMSLKINRQPFRNDRFKCRTWILCQWKS